MKGMRANEEDEITRTLAGKPQGLESENGKRESLLHSRRRAVESGSSPSPATPFPRERTILPPWVIRISKRADQKGREALGNRPGRGRPQ